MPAGTVQAETFVVVQYVHVLPQPTATTAKAAKATKQLRMRIMPKWFLNTAKILAQISENNVRIDA
jgi:hypothetical protein